MAKFQNESIRNLLARAHSILLFILMLIKIQAPRINERDGVYKIKFSAFCRCCECCRDYVSRFNFIAHTHTFAYSLCQEYKTHDHFKTLKSTTIFPPLIIEINKTHFVF